MKLPITATYLLPLGLLALLAMVGCTPTTKGPAPDSTSSSPALPPAQPAVSTSGAKTEERPLSTAKHALPEKVILDGTVLKSTPGGWKLDAQAMEALKQTIEKVRASAPGTSLVVTGYSSSTRTRGKNISVSRHRAEFVANTLTSMGIPREKITVRSLGSSNPIADNATPNGRMKNRRVEIEFQEP